MKITNKQLLDEYDSGVPFWGSDSPEDLITKEFEIDEETKITMTQPVFVWQMIKHVQARMGEFVEWRGIHEACSKDVDDKFGYDVLFADSMINHFCIIYPDFKPEDFWRGEA